MKSTRSLVALAIGIAALASIPAQVVEANTGTSVLRTHAETPVTREDTTSAPSGALRRSEVVRGARVYADTEGQLREALWALDRYATEGLSLPALTIRFSDTNEACGGNAGVRRLENGANVIDICTEARWTLLHELAHVWAAENLTDADRAGFVELQGLEGWSGSDIAWEDRGTEQAADLVAWALSGRSHVPGHVWRGSVALMEKAYLVLTGASEQE